MSSKHPLLKYFIALQQISGIGNITARQLIAYLGSVEAVFTEKQSVLQKVPGVGPLLSANIKEKDYLAIAEKELEFIDKYKIKAQTFLDSSYPNRLKQCEDAPLVLFQKGKGNLNKAIHISIVGTRKATEYGKHYCKKIIQDLKEYGINPVIISGLAYGVDACSHKAALNEDLETWAVLGHGLDRIYPSQHKNLAKQILEKGSLLTEFSHGSFPAPSNFISRNRIIAGLSDLTIIIESARKGGSLVTADLAFNYNREVMAVPGRIGDTKSEGCNFLIKSNKASMLENFDDIIYTMGWNDKHKLNKNKQLNLFEQLSSEEKILLEFLRKNENSSIDKIMRESNIDKNKVSIFLLNLEFINLIKVLPGKRYRAL